jgi:hypothetical protein
MWPLFFGCQDVIEYLGNPRMNHPQNHYTWDMGGINPLMNSNEGLVSDIAGFVEAIC